MNAVPQHRARAASLIGSLCLASSVLVTPCFAAAYGQSGKKPTGAMVKVSLSEWKVRQPASRAPLESKIPRLSFHRTALSSLRMS